MKKRTKKHIEVGYYLWYGISYLHALLPLSALYILSDALYFFLYYLARYRRKVVRKNLTNTFPSKSKKEIEKIEKDFYRFLCDYFVETIKLLHISDKEIKQRMKFDNPELINELTQSGTSCFLCLGHYGNWEYVPSIGFYLSPNVVQGQIYKQLHNKTFDCFFLKIRSRFSPKCIEKGEVFRTIVKNKNEGRPMVIGFVADQRPPRYLDHYWTTFLNQNTLALTGMERIAAKFGFAVVYLDIQRVKRGYYRGTFSLITADASKEKKFAVTEKYMRELEKTILRDPAYWLWSHNRWKFTKKTNPSA